MSAKPVREGLFVTDPETGTASLLGSRCAGCSQVAFPASEFCPYCGGEHTRVIPLPQEGTIELCTVVRKSSPNYRGPTPYGLAVVRLTPDLVIIAKVDTQQVLAPGTAVRCMVQAVGEDDDGNVLLAPCFRPLHLQSEMERIRVAGS